MQSSSQVNYFYAQILMNKANMYTRNCIRIFLFTLLVFSNSMENYCTIHWHNKYNLVFTADIIFKTKTSQTHWSKNLVYPRLPHLHKVQLLRGLMLPPSQMWWRTQYQEGVAITFTTKTKVSRVQPTFLITLKNLCIHMSPTTTRP